MDEPGSVLIFDLDGTLIHTETVTVPATREAFVRHGLEAPDDDEICSFIGRTADEYNAWLVTLCPPELARQVVRTAADRELERIGRTGALYPGVREALGELRPVARAMALCSNGSRRYVEAVTKAYGIAALFDAVRCRQKQDRSKSQMIGELLGRLCAPGTYKHGAVIGDRLDDVRAAHANGLLAVGCAYGYGRDGELDEADALAARATDLASTVQRLLAR